MKTNYETIDSLNSAFSNLPLKSIDIMTAAENMIVLEPHLKAALSVKDKLIKENTGGKEQISNNHKNWHKFTLDYGEILKKEINIEGLQKIKKSNIDLDRPSNVNLQNLIKVLKQNGLLEE